MTVVQLLLLLSGDVELNPGPPKRTTVKAPEAKKEATKSPEEQIGTLETKVNEMVISQNQWMKSNPFNTKKELSLLH